MSKEDMMSEQAELVQAVRTNIQRLEASLGRLEASLPAEPPPEPSGDSPLNMQRASAWHG